MMTPAQSIQWKPKYTLQESAVSTTLQAWLLHSGSFMQRLAEKGVTDSHIKVLSQTWQVPDEWEATQLHLIPGDQALIREVLILNEDYHWMFARTIFPRECLSGDEAELAHLGTRSLGSVLFKHPDMRRSDFAYACLEPHMPWYQHIAQSIHTKINNPTAWWARYSTFHLGEKSLLLTEVFFPDVAIL